jgi:hypothetical protein
VDEYRVRRTVFERESTLRVQDGALVRGHDGADAQRIALSDVRKVALSYQPLGLLDRWVCSVETAHGRIWLPSASFLGFNLTEDHRARFRPFVEALSQLIAAQPSGPSVQFIKGNNLSAYGCLVLLILAAVMTVLLALAILGSMMDGHGLGGATWTLFMPIIVLLLSARMVWPIWRRNRRHVFDPKAFPADFAPLR